MAELTEQERKFMDTAFTEARDALVHGEVPVGCVFVHRNVIVARGRNTVNETRNATRHAEINCVDQIMKLLNLQKSQKIRDKNCILNELEWSIFEEIDVYVTVEPCAMCADALGQLCVRSVTFGCSNERFGGCGSVVDVPNIYNYDTTFRRNVDKERAVQLLKDFYRGENPNAPTGKAKRKQPKS